MEEFEKNFNNFFIALVVITLCFIFNSCKKKPNMTGSFDCHTTNESGETRILQINNECTTCETEEEFLYVSTLGFDCDSITNLIIN
jgi:hypothetical protein